jgi:energy-coupling factor transporter ATP-binding protein EcfA2
MLQSLSIRDVVLIDRLDLDCRPGLSVLTGETGAGKSILLDALGLALGRRSEAGLVRPGAQQASVTAVFDLEPGHPALSVLDEQGIPADPDGLVLRRVLSADGRSRGFINDTPVNVRLMRAVADRLVEIEGQFEDAPRPARRVRRRRSRGRGRRGGARGLEGGHRGAGRPARPGATAGGAARRPGGGDRRARRTCAAAGRGGGARDRARDADAPGADHLRVQRGSGPGGGG